MLTKNIVLYKKDLLNDENNKIHKKLKEKNNVNVTDDKKEILNKMKNLLIKKRILVEITTRRSSLSTFKKLSL